MCDLRPDKRHSIKDPAQPHEQRDMRLFQQQRQAPDNLCERRLSLDLGHLDLADSALHGEPLQGSNLGRIQCRQ